MVIDDGSADDPETVAARYPGVVFIKGEHGGSSAARNAGLAATSADCVLFLDADDVLLPSAIEANLRCLAGHPGAGFVYGGHRRVDVDLTRIDAPFYIPPAPQAYLQLLAGNFINMHCTVLYDRRKLMECGGFDPEIPLCEDYDALIRVARRHPIAGHPSLVAKYRVHEDNISTDAAKMHF